MQRAIGAFEERFMLRIMVVSVLLMLASPALAGGDDFLKQIFDADGPTITDGQPTIDAGGDHPDRDGQMDDAGGQAVDGEPTEDDYANSAAELEAAYDAAHHEDDPEDSTAPFDGVPTILMSPFERADIDRARSEEPPVVDDPPPDDEQASDEPSADDPPADDPAPSDDEATDPAE